MNQKSSNHSRRALSALVGFLGATVALSGTPAHAQQSEIDLLRQQLAEMTARLQKLEDVQLALKNNPPAPPVTSNSKLPVVVSGLLQVRGDNFFSDDRTPATRQPDTFRLRRGEIRLTAGLLRDKANTYDKISGTAMFDIAKTGTLNASPLQEIQITYTINKTPTSSNILDFGQFKLPFGYEGDLVSTSALQMTERALFYRNGTDPFGGRAGDIRDTGVRLRGNFSQFAYDLGIFNGLGERQNQSALSDTKAYLGRLIFRPTSMAGLQVGVSAARGNQRNNSVTAGTPPVTTTNNRAERDLLNAFVVYKLDKITAQAEYFKSKFLNSTVGSTSRRDRSSYYAHLGYLFKPKFEGVLRYDMLDIDNAPGATSNKTKETSIGFNYYLKGNNAKIQTNVVKVDGNAAATSTDRTELRTQLQVAF